MRGEGLITYTSDVGRVRGQEVSYDYPRASLLGIWLVIKTFLSHSTNEYHIPSLRFALFHLYL